jgi:hypothetical protein
VSTQTAALIQVILEGVPLPASKAELVDYARREDPDAAALLQALPEREYRSLDEVGEALAPVQPLRAQPGTAVPREESDKPPGGDAYIEPHPEPGAVRHDAPPANPPQTAIEKQSKAQNEQLERQQEKLGPEG